MIFKKYQVLWCNFPQSYCTEILATNADEACKSVILKEYKQGFFGGVETSCTAIELLGTEKAEYAFNLDSGKFRKVI